MTVEMVVDLQSRGAASTSIRLLSYSYQCGLPWVHPSLNQSYVQSCLDSKLVSDSVMNKYNNLPAQMQNILGRLFDIRRLVEADVKGGSIRG